MDGERARPGVGSQASVNGWGWAVLGNGVMGVWGSCTLNPVAVTFQCRCERVSADVPAQCFNHNSTPAQFPEPGNS